MESTKQERMSVQNFLDKGDIEEISLREAFVKEYRNYHPEDNLNNVVHTIHNLNEILESAEKKLDRSKTIGG